MTPTNKNVYEYIVEFNKIHKYCPSTTYIAKHFGVSVQSIQHTFKVLREKGLIEKVQHEPRGDYKLI